MEEREEEDDSQPPQQPPMWVDISPSMEHQRHVLHQYTISQDNTEKNPPQFTETPLDNSVMIPFSDRSPSPTANQEQFTVPIPQVHLPDTWETARSVPAVSHTKSHSCQQSDSAKRLSKTRAVTPTPSPSTLPPTISLKLRPQPVVYNAWAAVKPNVPTKHTTLTSSRLMTK